MFVNTTLYYSAPAPRAQVHRENSSDPTSPTWATSCQRMRQHTSRATLRPMKHVSQGKRLIRIPIYVFFLGDNPCHMKTWSATSGRVPTFRRNAASGKFWFPYYKRWMTNSEKPFGFDRLNFILDLNYPLVDQWQWNDLLPWPGPWAMLNWLSLSIVYYNNFKHLNLWVGPH